MNCVICGQQSTSLCGEHSACLSCHERELQQVAMERNSAWNYIQMLQNEPPTAKVRTWAERTIGSQWNPADKTEIDDIDRTVATIHKYLSIGA